ncbi:MAG: hypothetical protein J7J86_02600, partial [Bacteroidales bacterium]|nr:hypothetical protein [Bacteroidales bacterium]
PSESDISIHYKLKHLTMGVGMYLPFAESYKTTTIINESYIINNYTTQIYDNGRMLYLRLSYNFAFDKQLNWNKKLSNEDNDTGVLKD